MLLSTNSRPIVRFEGIKCVENDLGRNRSRRSVFFEIDVLKNFALFTGKNLYWRPNKVK